MCAGAPLSGQQAAGLLGSGSRAPRHDLPCRGRAGPIALGASAYGPRPAGVWSVGSPASCAGRTGLRSGRKSAPAAKIAYPRPPRCGGLPKLLAARLARCGLSPYVLSHPTVVLGVFCHLPLQPAPPGMKDRASQVRSLVSPGPQPGPPVGGGASAGAVEGQNGSPPKTIAVPQATAKRPGLWTIPPPAWGYCWRFGQRDAPRLRALCGLRLG